MLSRVADSLYWMSRYLERADTTARVIDATYSLMLSRIDPAAGERPYRALMGMVLEASSVPLDPEEAIGRLARDATSRSSILGCLAAARDNASQVREEISAEMWEQLNRLYHETLVFGTDAADEATIMRLANIVREGSYAFRGISESTMTHGEGWRFVQLGKAIERASAVCILLDAYFGRGTQMDDLDLVALLASCAAFDAYCKIYTADLKPDRIAMLLLLHPDFPYSVRYSVERISRALVTITALSAPHERARIGRAAGRLRSSLEYAEIDDLLAGDLHRFLAGVLQQCRQLHAAVYEAFIDYPIETAFQE